MTRMMTSADVARALQYADLRTARKLMLRLGADPHMRPYRLPRARFEAWLNERERITEWPTPDPVAPEGLRASAGSGRDPGVPSPSGWWREEPAP